MIKMKKLLVVFFLLASFGCQGSGVTIEQTVLLEQSTIALEQWKQSQVITDGCSSPWFVGMWSGLVGKNWDDCCWQHDFDYEVGWQYGITRSIADQDLHDCVWAAGHPQVADLMWAAVRLFGWSHYEGGK